MNENINLVEILKDCPRGTILYSTIYGYVEFDCIKDDFDYPVIVHIPNLNGIKTFTSDGRLHRNYEGECLLFPSKEQRIWSKWVCPKPKKPKFDPKTLKAFDMVLVKMKEGKIWYADIISVSANENKLDYCTITIGDADYDWVIPYNDDTKHLVGTTEEAPEYYRYWED